MPAGEWPDHLLGHPGVRVRVLAERVQLLLAAPAVAAGDRERHDHAVADLQVVHLRPDLDHLAHELVAQDVALLHRRDEAVVEVEVGAADRRRGDLDDGVAAVQDLRVRHVLDLDGALALPADRPHRAPPRDPAGDGAVELARCVVGCRPRPRRPTAPRFARPAGRGRRLVEGSNGTGAPAAGPGGASGGCWRPTARPRRSPSPA